ncbi:hypothetical protein Unana1_07898 [Umbelopsis nana]
MNMPDITKHIPLSSDNKPKKGSSYKGDRKKKSNGLNGSLDSVKKEAKNASGTATKKIKSVQDKAKDTVKDAKHQVQDSSEQVKDTAQDTTEQVKDQAQATSEQVKDTAQDTSEQVKDQAQGVSDKVQNGLKEAAGKLNIPEHFLSNDFMQQSGFDDNDARKLMKAIMEYNAKSLQQPEEDQEGEQEEPAEKQAEKQPQENGEQEQKTEALKVEKNPQINGTTDGLGGLLENNIKCEPVAEATKTLKDLTGKTVDKNGNIKDDADNIIGKVKGGITDVEGKTVNEQGDVVDDSGKVFGKAEVFDKSKVADVNVSTQEDGQSGQIHVRHGDSDLIIKVDATKTGISFSIHIPRPQ